MATTKGLKDVMKTPDSKATEVPKQLSSLELMLKKENIQARFQRLLGKKSAGFMSSLLTLTNNNKLLKNANPVTIISAASIAASLDLPINPSLGFAWIIPYKGVASFQIGYKGILQLAQRSGHMKRIISVPVYEGEIAEFNKFTEDFKPGDRVSDNVVGYFASFELINGFKKSTYWTKDEVIKWATKYSQSYRAGNDIWRSEFDKMACKTVLKNILSTYAPMSIEMQMGISFDEKPVKMLEDGSYDDFDLSAEDVTTEPPKETPETVEANLV